MSTPMLKAFVLGVVAVAIGLGSVRADAADDAKPGETRVAKWRGDAKAAFQLWFDDGCPSHVKNAVPELVKRKLQATFYLNPGAGHYKPFAKQWEEQFPKLGFEYGNHTFTHQGAQDAADLEGELTKCNEVLARIAAAGARPPGLVSFGRPGVKQGAWTVSDEDVKTVLAKHNLIERPKLDHGIAGVQVKTATDVLSAVDKVVASGGSDFVLFHGVGGDWLSFPMPEFVKLLDELEKRRGAVWCGGAIETFKYAAERNAATVKVLEITDQRVRVSLQCTTDPKLYDAPLTLVTRVPTAWTECVVKAKGAPDARVTAAEGQIRYDVAPTADVITIERAGQ
jgi:peptidoglycan/xylan/chitin deacetylase (PgdA/CDA1 family)